MIPWYLFICSFQSAQQEESNFDASGAKFRRYLRSLKEKHEGTCLLFCCHHKTTNVFFLKKNSLFAAVNVVDELGYDAENTDGQLHSLNSFDSIKRNSKCVFAKRSLLWGSPDWAPSLSLEQNAMRIAPALSLCMEVVVFAIFLGLFLKTVSISLAKAVHWTAFWLKFAANSTVATRKPLVGPSSFCCECGWRFSSTHLTRRFRTSVVRCATWSRANAAACVDHTLASTDGGSNTTRSLSS